MSKVEGQGGVNPYPFHLAVIHSFQEIEPEYWKEPAVHDLNGSNINTVMQGIR